MQSWPTTLPASPPKTSPTASRDIKSHSWYFGNRTFTRDLFGVVIGEDRTVIPTRAVGLDGRIALKKP